MLRLISRTYCWHFALGYDRPNLFFEVREKPKKLADVMPAMLLYIRTHDSQATGIVYCFSKKDCEKAAAFLTFNKVKTLNLSLNSFYILMYTAYFIYIFLFILFYFIIYFVFYFFSSASMS